jgi:hypothetical protein
MNPLIINTITKETIKASFDKIAESLFNNYRLKVNESYYRLLDIEFYYYAEDSYKDVYTHKHDEQLKPGKWYFHGSGIDITIGNEKHHGGILIRAIARISEQGDPNKYFIEKEIHGPLNVKTEICANLYGAFEEKANVFQLEDIADKEIPYFVKPVAYHKTKRIGLNVGKGGADDFHEAKLRYVIFPKLKLKDKTQIAKDMLSEGMEITDINKALGSVFLK